MNGGKISERGYTIIELMVAITIGLLILAGLATFFATNSRERGEIERANQQTENGRYALQVITDDLRNAGYFASFNPGTFDSPNAELTVPTAVPDPCNASLVGVGNAFMLPVQGYDNGAALTANCTNVLTDLMAGTDILVVHRASTCALNSANCDPLVAGAPYFQASGCATEISANSYYLLDTNTANLTLHLKDCATVAPIYQLRTHIYFIANNDKPGDGIPTLKRAELGGGLFNIVPLVEGVQNLQIEYGLDTAPAGITGAPALYTANPNNGCAPAVCVGNWWNTVAVKVNVLTRNTTVTAGYVDTKTYTLGSLADGVTPNTVGPFNDSYKRHMYYSVARLNNVAGRNTP